MRLNLFRSALIWDALSCAQCYGLRVSAQARSGEEGAQLQTNAKYRSASTSLAVAFLSLNPLAGWQTGAAGGRHILLSRSRGAAQAMAAEHGLPHSDLNLQVVDSTLPQISKLFQAEAKSQKSHTGMTPLPLDAMRRKMIAAMTAMVVAAPLLFAPPAVALTDEQELVAEVWRGVTSTFVDRSFNGQGMEGWKKLQKDTVTRLKGKEGDLPEAYEASRKILATLNDPYTRYLDPEQYKVLTSAARGATAGIGVQLQLDPVKGGVMIVSTVKDAPAAAGGVLASDEVIAVDGNSLAGDTAELAATRMRGVPGTPVVLSVRHANGETETIRLIRAEVKVTPVEAEVITLDSKKVGVVRIRGFSQETEKQLLDAVQSVKPVDYLVVDLRGNAGGYMPAGVESAKMFLPGGAIVTTEVTRDGPREPYTAEGIGTETMPLYILVDGRTASASEIFAGALQDNKRATIVGQGNTFGKGRIQNLQELSQGGVAITRAKYLTPNGRDINGVGLAPDVISKTCGVDDTAEACMAAVKLGE